MPDADKLTNADLSDLAAAFTFALRYQGRKRVRNADELMAAELAKAERPVSTRELVQIICQTEGKNGQDRRVFADVTKRASKALREMRRLGIVASEQDRRGTFVWAPSRKGEYHNVTTFGQSGEESVVRAIPHPSCLGGRPDRNCCHLVRISKGRLC